MTTFQMIAAYLFFAVFILGGLWAIMGMLSTRGKTLKDWEEPDWRSLDRRFRGEE